MAGTVKNDVARGPVLTAFLVFGSFWGSWAALVPGVQEALGLSQGELGLALLGIGLGALPAMALAGAAIDRFSGLVLPASFAALAVSALLPGFAGSLPALGAALFLVGGSSGAADVAINAEVAALEAATGARFMALAHALLSLGLIVGAVSTGIARQLGADRLDVLVVAAVVLSFTAWLNRRPYPRVTDATPSRRRIRGTLVALGAVCALAFVIEGGIENWSALFLERELDAQPAISALGPAAFAIAMVAGRLSTQSLQRRLGDRVILAGGACVSVVGMLVVSTAGHAAVAIGGFALGGAGVSVAAPILFGAAGRGAPEAERGAAVATVTTIAYLGFLCGPPILGGLAQLLGLRASFLLLAFLAGAVALAAPRLRVTDFR